MIRLTRMILIALVVWAAATVAALAVNPDEMLADPALEARARDISAELRCLVCQNQSIDDSDAELASDLRLLVRKRLVAGDSDSQVINYVVSRYGEFVLLKPRFSARTLLLWGAPAVVFLVGMTAMILGARNRRASRVSTPLSAEEQAEVDRLMQRDS